jgi:hypothetical protein
MMLTGIDTSSGWTGNLAYACKDAGAGSQNAIDGDCNYYDEPHYIKPLATGQWTSGQESRSRN